MFYQYTRPKRLYQHLHNILSTGIIKTGQLLGLLWLNITPDGQSFTLGTKTSFLWATTASTVEITFLTYYLYYRIFENPSQYGATGLNVILSVIADGAYVTLSLGIYLTATFGRKNILTVVNFAATLQNQLSEWEIRSNEKCCRKVLTYQLMTKIVIDGSLLLFGTITVSGMSIMTDPSCLNITRNILEAVSLVAYNFASTVYFIPLAFALFLMQKISGNLKCQELHEISRYYQEIVKFMRKVNLFMETLVCLLLLEAFVVLVTNVRSYTFVIIFIFFILFWFFIVDH